MPEEIHKGLDCRKTFKTPRRRIKIAPRRLHIKPGQLVGLSAGGAPYECDPGCYWWYQSTGEGTMSPEFGKSTNYRAPKFLVNVDCKMTVTIHLLIGGFLLDTAIFTINTVTDKRIAYDIITLKQTIKHITWGATWPPPTGPQPPEEATTDRIRMYTWANQYTCADKFVHKYAWETRDFLWYYNHRKGKWFLFYGPTNLNFTSIEEMQLYYKELNKHRKGDIIDKRDWRDKKDGCCPLKLMVKERERPDIPLPYY